MQTSILTKDAILDISMGFKKQYNLQVLRLDFQKDCIQMILSDGRVIIGGKYNLIKQMYQKDANPIRLFDVLKINCQFKGDHQPLLIKDYVFEQRELTQSLAMSAMTLSQYRKISFLAPTKDQNADVFRQSQPQKKRKIHQANCSYKPNKQLLPAFNQHQQKEQNLQQTIIQGANIELIEKNKQKIKTNEYIIENTQKIKQNTLLSGVYNQQTKKSQQNIIDLSQENKYDIGTQHNNYLQRRNQEENNTLKFPIKPLLKNVDHYLLNNLYQGMSSFKIICRINYLQNQISFKKQPQIKLILRDQAGNEMLAYLKEKLYQGFISDTSFQQQKIMVGKTYSFIGVQIYKNKQKRQVANLLWQNVKEDSMQIAQFNENKILTVGDCLKLEDSYFFPTKINLCDKQTSNENISSAQKQFLIFGIYQEMKQKTPRFINSVLVSIKGFLIDPICKKKIQFTISTIDKQFVPRGTLLLLHNVRIYIEQNCKKIKSSSISYYSIQNNNPLFNKFITVNWDKEQYENISQPIYTLCTIRKLIQTMEHYQSMEIYYSQVQCLIKQLKEKVNYKACKNCCHKFNFNVQNHGYCLFCRTTQSSFRRIIYQAHLSDATSSFQVELKSQKIQKKLGLGDHYIGLNNQQKKLFLDLCRYNQIKIKIKSQRVVGGIKHNIMSVKKTDHKKIMKQIRQQSIKERIFNRQSWE